VVCVDDVNLFGRNINTIRNTETVLQANEEVGLEINTKKTKYMCMSHHQNTGQSHRLVVANVFQKMWQSSDIWEQQ
jgi:hypothetical protein